MAHADRPCTEFRDDVVKGLSAPQKSIPGKYLWDTEGSRLFEEISRQPAYYQTRAEAALTQAALPALAATIGPRATIVEFGAGAGHKIRLLLDHLQDPAAYIAVDISAEFLQSAVARLAADYPKVAMRAAAGDYSKPLPALDFDRAHSVLGYLPGTSVGNMLPADGVLLLARLRDVIAPGYLLIGQDPNRDPNSLRDAYEGPLMTALHLNVLRRLERELGAQLDTHAFRHESRAYPDHVEPHLVAVKATSIKIDDFHFAIAAGESIRTDYSWKYLPKDFADVAASAGWAMRTQWADPDGRFTLFLLRA